MWENGGREKGTYTWSVLTAKQEDHNRFGGGDPQGSDTYKKEHSLIAKKKRRPNSEKLMVSCPHAREEKVRKHVVVRERKGKKRQEKKGEGGGNYRKRKNEGGYP